MPCCSRGCLRQTKIHSEEGYWSKSGYSSLYHSTYIYFMCEDYLIGINRSINVASHLLVTYVYHIVLSFLRKNLYN